MSTGCTHRIKENTHTIGLLYLRSSFVHPIMATGGGRVDEALAFRLKDCRLETSHRQSISPSDSPLFAGAVFLKLIRSVIPSVKEVKR